MGRKTSLKSKISRYSASYLNPKKSVVVEQCIISPELERDCDKENRPYGSYIFQDNKKRLNILNIIEKRRNKILLRHVGSDPNPQT